jgi:hypothetical protein
MVSGSIVDADSHEVREIMKASNTRDHKEKGIECYRYLYMENPFNSLSLHINYTYQFLFFG